MKHILFFLLFVSFHMHAQVIKGKIIDADTQKAIEDADIFIDQTSVGTSSNADGVFELNTKGLQQQVIVNAFGYRSKVFAISDFQSAKTIHLEAEGEELQEIVIDAALFSRKDLLKTFKYFFLGNTANGKRAVIENEDDLVLYYDKEKFVLFCESPKPIKVYNRNLGYHVLFYLKNAQISFKHKTINPLAYSESAIFGFTSYVDLSKKVDQFKKPRNKVFAASANPFWIAFLKDEMKENNYYFYLNKMLFNRDEYFKVIEEGENFKIELIKTPIVEKPVKGRELAPFNVTRIDRKEERSLFYVVDTVFNINKNGFLLNPQSIIYGGYFADLKVADMLPIDYQP